MSVAPQGMPVTQLYRWYRNGEILVNRRYQRKLVWTVAEKQRLIGSIMFGYPIPLFLLARQDLENDKYEVIDGMQRLNAIFSFIENGFPLEDGRYFDVSQFATAMNMARKGLFSQKEGATLLSPSECANIIEYQLAITIFPTTNEDEVTEVFGRINSSGKQLSNQERRQAGVVTPFAELVRQIAAELRGDVSQEILTLTKMPEISVESCANLSKGYRLRAEDIFWCKQGVIRMPQLRDSEDEEIIADIAASILLSQPLSRSRTLLDQLYDPDSKSYLSLEKALRVYTPYRLAQEIKTSFSVLRETIEKYDFRPNCFRRIVSPNAGPNAVKTEFYAVFMAFFQLVIREEKSPDNPEAIMQSLQNLHNRFEKASSNTIRRDIRERNISLTIGLLQTHFVKREPPLLGHGSGLALDFENSLRRSRIETPRYEFKQGLLTLAPNKRELDQNLLIRIIEHICGIANSGYGSAGYLYVGVADDEEDSKKIEQLDSINPIIIGDKYVVGIDREAHYLNLSIEEYVTTLVNKIRSSALSEPLKSNILNYIDIVDYKALSVIRILIPEQKEVSFVGDTVYVREGSSTVKVPTRQIIEIHSRFQRQ